MQRYIIYTNYATFTTTFFAKPLFLLPRARFNKGGVKCHLGNPEKHTDFHTETYRLSVRKSVCFLV